MEFPTRFHCATLPSSIGKTASAGDHVVLLHQVEHLVPDRGQVQLMGNRMRLGDVELSTVVDPINAPVRFQWVYISYGARLPSNSGSTSHMQLDYPQTVSLHLTCS